MLNNSIKKYKLSTFRANTETIFSVKLEYATLGAGCFWCVEAIFSSLKGVISVEPGYCGGNTENPSYEEVCTGETGHVEVCQVEFDNEQISFAKLLEVFWKIHDPTTIDQQGADIGNQYRSVIFYHNEEQNKTGQEILIELELEKIWAKPIVTSARKKTQCFGEFIFILIMNLLRYTDFFYGTHH